MPKDTGTFLTRMVQAVASLEGEKSDPPDSFLRIETSQAEYFFDPKPIEGYFSLVYFGYKNNLEKTGITLKLAKEARYNDFIQNEIKVLQHLRSQEAPQLKHIPALLDQFRTDQGLIGLIFEQFDGYSLKEIRENPRYANGVPAEHVGWMFCRLMSVVGYAHKQGVIHGNIEPENILIQPSNHNLCLLDWTVSMVDPGKNNDKFKLFNPDYSAPEVKEKRNPTPSADLYSAGKCMIYLLGGDIKTNKLSESVDERISLFFNYFLLPSPLQRAQDAWEMYAQMENLRTEIWGKKKFIEFKW